jgi:hypothetical protein
MALDERGQVDLLAPEAKGLEKTVEEHPRSPLERFALPVFVEAWGLTDYEQPGVQRPLAEDDLRP